MDPTIIKVSPVNEVFSLTWEIGRRCNYDCMYCAPMWHDNTSKHKTLAELQTNWESIFAKTSNKNLKYKIAFTGGEVTANKDFLPFLEWLRANYTAHLFQVLVTTNGSASPAYYKKLFDAVDNISFSTHSEHFNESKFFDMVVKLSKQVDHTKFIHVNIMDEFWNRDRIPAYIKILKDNAISHNVNQIDYSHQTRVVPIMKGNLNLAI